MPHPRNKQWFNFYKRSKLLTISLEKSDDSSSVNSLPFFRNPGVRQRGRLRVLGRTLSAPLFIYVALFIFVVYILNVLSSGIPSTYQEIRQFERSLPQHNLTKAIEAGTRYLRISTPVTGRGFNNVLQEALLHSYLALYVNRAFVFEDYVWSQSPFPYTLYDTSLRPSRMPFNAFISGPTAGGAMPYPRAISAEFWNIICPPSRRKIISSIDQPDNVEGSVLLDWWKGRLEDIEDSCVEINSEKKIIFDFMLFGDTRILSLWPGLSKSPIYTAFEWSALVQSVLHRNVDIIDPTSVRALSAGDTSLRGLIAVHLRRGDFEGHCKFLFRWKAEYMGFNRFSELMDRFEPSKYQHTEAIKQYYMDHCIPEVDYIVRRLKVVRKANPGINRVYALTNGKKSWIDELKGELLKDGWLGVKSSLDLHLDSRQRQVSMAVDMAIAERAEVFLGNGFSSLTSNVVTLRIAKGLPFSSNRYL